MTNHRPLIVIGVFLLLAVLGVVISLYQSGQKVPYRSSSKSYSMIGHHALMELLRKNDFRVLINERRQPEPEKDEKLLVFAPQPGETEGGNGSRSPTSWRRLSGTFDREMIVLPKWTGSRHPENERWMWAPEFYPESLVEDLLPDATGWDVTRFKEVSDGDPESSGRAHTIRSTVTGNEWTIHAASLQSFASDVPADVLWRVGDRPIVVRQSSPDRIWVSDPDLMNNQFLSKDQNAAFSLHLLKRIFPERRLLVDEYHRGFRVHESLMSMIFTFPGLVLTLNLSFLILCFYWSLHNRWSERRTEVHEQRSRVEQAETVGRLTNVHGDHRRATTLYVSSVRSAVARTLHLPASADWERIAERLDRIRPQVAERIRDVRPQIQQLNDQSAPEVRLLSVARQVNRIINQVQHEIGQEPQKQAAEGNQ